MKISLRWGLLSAFAFAGCSLGTIPPDLASQNAAIQRWHGCIERYDATIEHSCEGHKRDVIATFPVHLERTIDKRLSREIISKQPLNEETFIRAFSEARKSDL